MSSLPGGLSGIRKFLPDSTGGEFVEEQVRNTKTGRARRRFTVDAIARGSQRSPNRIYISSGMAGGKSKR